jgi:hypothetical protein
MANSPLNNLSFFAEKAKKENAKEEARRRENEIQKKLSLLYDKISSNAEMGNTTHDSVAELVGHVDDLATHPIHINLAWMSILLSVVTIPMNIIRIINNLFFSKEHKAERGMKIAMGVAGILFGGICLFAAVGTLIIATPILVLIGTIKGVIENIWMLGVAIFQRFANKSTDPELLEKQNIKIASRAHGLMQSAVALVGAILLFTPLFKVGIAILAGTAAYGLADAFNLNPFKWAARGIISVIKKITGKAIQEKLGITPRVSFLNSLIYVFKKLNITKDTRKITIIADHLTKTRMQTVIILPPIIKKTPKKTKSLTP